MKVALAAFGSAGDVHPMLVLGQCLKQRGHGVTILTHPNWVTLVQSAGLDVIAVGDPHIYDQTLDHPKLWHPMDGLGVMWRYLLKPVMRPTYDALQQLHGAGLDVVVASPVAFGARVACERSGTPLLSVYTAATMLRSHQCPLTVASWQIPSWMPRWGMKAVWRVLDHFKLEPLVRPALDSFRQQLGLPPIQGTVFGDWMHSPDGGLTLFPRWFAHADDWPDRVVQAGFMVHEGDSHQGLSPALEGFLQQGAAPLVFMPGTAQRFAARFYELAAAACERLNVRGILLGAHAPRSSGQLTLSVPYAPFSLLLPRSCAVVHHGGIGTCAQALKWGCPQAVIPSAYDQFDNAMRLKRLGVAVSLPMTNLDVSGMIQLVRQLTTDTHMRHAAEQWSAQMDVEDFRGRACDAVEALSR
jgi:rhamnosyltransferase subunit B